ncbi:hypothetical protein ACIQF8_19900 [Pseudarthrobacter sp. NPDC092184]|uniref:hypothetical protein n=1 Tax=unclassified Pseudarthrobacter TaxID=2647000 RepID=UPI0038079127
MGKSGKLAVIAGVVAAGLLVLTGMTLAEPVFVAFLGVLALACLACIVEILKRGRRVALLAASAGTSLTVAFSLAFVSTWELAFAGEPSFFGTPLPTGDPDNYFFGAAAAALATLFVLFLGAAWPRGRRLRTAAGRGRAGKGKAGKGRAAAGHGAGGNRRTTTAGRPAAKGTAQRRPAARIGGAGTGSQGTGSAGAGSQGTGGAGTGKQGTGGLRAPAKVPSLPARRPSSASPAGKPSSASPAGKPSSASPAGKPSSATGAKAAPRR